MANDRPQDVPLTLAESAIGLHEFYTSLVDAGFDEDQALYLVAELLSGQAGGGGYVEEY